MHWINFNFDMNSDTFINSNDLISRNAFALAITRGRYISITHYGERHAFLNEIERDCCQIDIHKALSDNSLKIIKGF